MLVLMHDDLIPPETVEEVEKAAPEEFYRWQMEWDVLEALRELEHEVRPLGVRDELAPIRTAIDEWRPHIVFDLLRHFHDVTRYDAYVVSYLELLRTPYTGCNPRGLIVANDKVLSKKILAWHRIPTPAFAVFRLGRAVRMPRRLEFPLIVKSATEHASLGIAQASIVYNEESLAERVDFVHRRIGSDALAEQYIEGRELYVGIVGNERLQALPIWELTFQSLPDRSHAIATSRVKWDLKYQERAGVEDGPARNLDEALSRKIVHDAKRIYRALGLSGYARIDLRLTPEGRAYFLEANPNPDLSLDEAFAEAAKAGGLEYTQLIQRLLNLGLRYAAEWKGEV